MATAPRETFEGTGTGRKAGASPREAIRRGHLISRVRTDVLPRGPASSHPPRGLCLEGGTQGDGRDEPGLKLHLVCFDLGETLDPAVRLICA